VPHIRVPESAARLVAIDYPDDLAILELEQGEDLPVVPPDTEVEPNSNLLDQLREATRSWNARHVDASNPIDELDELREQLKQWESPLGLN
jgi:hypothetical protein